MCCPLSSTRHQVTLFDTAFDNNLFFPSYAIADNNIYIFVILYHIIYLFILNTQALIAGASVFVYVLHWIGRHREFPNIYIYIYIYAYRPIYRYRFSVIEWHTCAFHQEIFTQKTWIINNTHSSKCRATQRKIWGAKWTLFYLSTTLCTIRRAVRCSIIYLPLLPKRCYRPTFFCNFFAIGLAVLAFRYRPTLLTYGLI